MSVGWRTMAANGPGDNQQQKGRKLNAMTMMAEREQFSAPRRMV